jgi:hypothetical protein
MKVQQNSVPLCAVTVCGVQNLISSCCTYPEHLQGKHKVNGKEFEFEREINLGALQILLL